MWCLSPCWSHRTLCFPRLIRSHAIGFTGAQGVPKSRRGLGIGALLNAFPLRDDLRLSNGRCGRAGAHKRLVGAGLGPVGDWELHCIHVCGRCATNLRVCHCRNSCGSVCCCNLTHSPSYHTCQSINGVLCVCFCRWRLVRTKPVRLRSWWRWVDACGPWTGPRTRPTCLNWPSPSCQGTCIHVHRGYCHVP